MFFAVIIGVDLSGAAAAVELAEPEDCKRFHVAVRSGDARAVDEALTAQGVGRLLPSGEAMIDIAAVRRMADGRVPEGWDGDFAAMLDYARSKGWLDEAGEAIRAHVEWSG
jgi:hypothetical protein